jgi:hypothetical protein
MEDQKKYNSKGGRPFLKKELSQKYHTIDLSFTKDQWDQFKKEQAKYDLSYVGYARMKVLEQTKDIAHSGKDYLGFQKELNKVGANLNQIAKHLNREGFEFVEGDTKVTFDNMVKLFLEIQHDR